MTQTENGASPVASVEEIQHGWHPLTLRVAQLEAEKDALERENKDLRFLLERVIDHRQKSHGELVLLLTGLISKLPINDVGVIVSKLVEHNTHVNQVLAALVKGTAEADLPQPMVLRALEQTKRDLVAALKPTVEELIRQETPLETEMLRSLPERPELFFSPRVARANRCWVKGQVPRERIVKEFGEEALVFFQDVTTDAKLNPRPKPEEIALAFKTGFEASFAQHANLLPDKRQELLELYRKVQRSKSPSDPARAQKNSFLKLSFMLELLHYYQNQNTEAPDVLCAQRLPALIEQMVITGPRDDLEERLIVEAESLLAFVVNPDHRQMVVNNVGKGGGAGKTLRYVLALRAGKMPEWDELIEEFVKHLLPPRLDKAPPPESLTAVVRLVKPDLQRLVVLAVMESDRLPPEEAEALGRALGAQLGLKGVEVPKKTMENIPVEMERQMAWDKIKMLISERADPVAIAAGIRNRLHARYDADEIKQSWITLIEADPISLIRVFCQLPYLADGTTDPVARAVMETYVSRLTHEKYAAAYHKVVNSLRNMFKANPDSPTLVTFMALVRWVDPAASNKLGADIGMPPPAS
jgi:hypothetical protein